MGESVAEATVIKWTKKPGDYVDADETVMEIATDKVDSDVPSPVSGTLTEQFFKENDVVQVGEVIAIIETAEPEKAEEPAHTHQEPHAPVEPVAAPFEHTILPPVVEQVIAPVEHVISPEVERHIDTPVENIIIPETNEPIVVPEVSAIHTHETPAIENPASINEPEAPSPVQESVFSHLTPPYIPHTETFEKEVPKAEDVFRSNVRFYSPLVKNIAAQEGISGTELDNIPGTGADGRLTKDDLLAYIQKRFQPVSHSSHEEQQPVSEPAAPTVEHTHTEPVSAQDAGPVAESLPAEAEAKQHEEPVLHPETESEKPKETTVSEPVAGIEPEISGTEIKEPEPTPAVESATAEIIHEPIADKEEEKVTEETTPTEESKAEAEQPAEEEQKPAGKSLSGADEIIEMDRMRRLIAEHMVMSKHVSPHVTSFVESDVTNLVLWREKIKASFEKKEGEKITFTPIFIEAVVRAIKDYPMINISLNGTQIIKKKDINISLATALPNGNLIAPVIKKADELNLLGLTKAVNDLASRARINKLKPDDIQGGTFTVTNIGTFGNVMGTPIINQPQVAILAIGAIRKKPAVIETLQGDMIGIRHMMYLSLSYDHRVVDGSLGGSFLKRISDYLENWDPGREI